MKKWILPLLTAALFVSGCGVLNETLAERRERRARESRLVTENVQSGNFSIDIERMYPLRGSSKSVTSYSVTVKDGKIDSHLPFIGRAWNVPYGGGHALTFEAEVGSYTVQPVRDGYEVTLYVKTDEDEHIYRFTIFDNGNTSLDVQSGNRDRISYSGNMRFPVD
jgi:hypothetical protein